MVLCDLTDDCGDMSDETLPECQLTIQDSFESDEQPFGLFHQVSSSTNIFYGIRMLQKAIPFYNCKLLFIWRQMVKLFCIVILTNRLTSGLGTSRLQMGARSRLFEGQRNRSFFWSHNLWQGRPLPLHQLNLAQHRREGSSSNPTTDGTPST